MTLVPQTQCCALLGIDPKTLRNWLRRAQMAFTTHPIDARLRCLTDAQVQELATLHARPLASDGRTSLSVLPVSSLPCQPESNDLPVSSTGSPAKAWLQQLAALETQVAALQAQVTQLTQEVHQARQSRWEQSLAPLEALLSQIGTGRLQGRPQAEPTSEPQAPESAKSRSSGLPPLVEYTADGTYLILCPTDGELTFPPDSPQWFAWLQTLSSLHFKGKLGSFSLHRRAGRQSWQARRERNGRRYYHSLGHTSLITLAALEQIALTLQPSVPSHS